jgi:hypothetical protein
VLLAVSPVQSIVHGKIVGSGRGNGRMSTSDLGKKQIVPCGPSDGA